MDYKKIEQLEKDDPTAETLALTNRWKELVKPKNYKMTNGVWKKYNPPIFHRMEIKRIEREIHQKINRLNWKRMEQHGKETPKEKSRREELFKVIKRNRNTPIQNNANEQEEMEDCNEETTSNNSNDSMDVPAIYFKKYLGATGVRYIQTGQPTTYKKIRNET